MGADGGSVQFISGDHACAEGALAAGLKFFGGYPITPSTEIAEHLVTRLPAAGGVFAQMEDELGSIAAIIGASVGGARAMTATSGPGFSLMMENLGLAAMIEAPIVVVDVMRGSPSTGLPTLVGQADVMQARYGSHGDYGIVAYTPSSPQEFFDLTVRAFNTADRYRVPVIVLGDEVVGHMIERVEIPPADRIPRVERPRPAEPPGEKPFLPYKTNGHMVPPMAHAGEGYRVHMTGLTHDERGYPTNDPAVHDALVRRLVGKVEKNARDIIETEGVHLKDAEIIVVAYGCLARSARQAVEQVRRQGIKAGLLRLVTLWPFADEVLKKLDRERRPKGWVVAELNLGQVAREVERCLGRPVDRVNHAGGRILEPELIADAIADCASAGRKRR